MIRITRVCPICERLGFTSAHGNTVAECEASTGRRCRHPEEHHPVPRRQRIRIAIEVTL